MSHSFVSGLFHCVFSTKGRRQLITPDLQDRLWPYMGGIARENGMTALSIGGIDDHVHVLLAISSTISVSKAIQVIKGGSSRWVHDTFPKHQYFSWQEGYGAFSIGVSQVERTVTYIQSQAEHHHKKSFQEEFLTILKTHGIPYDERYLWD
jgi:putative transposase